MPNSKKKIVSRELQIRNATIDETTGDLILKGMFTSFNYRYSIGMNWWTGNEEFEEIDPGAFDSAKFDKCFFKYNHSDAKFVMASYESGTISIDIRDDGAYTTVRIPPIQEAKDLYTLIQRGIVKKMSWAFTTMKESYDRKENVSRILAVDEVYDISAVPLPANDNTAIGVRNSTTADEEKFKKRYLEDLEIRKKKIKLKQLISNIQN